VALARAFSIRPKILFADEPTGNLDARTGRTIIDLILELNEAEGTTLVLVTHDPDIASRARRTILLSDGRIAEDRAAASCCSPGRSRWASPRSLPSTHSPRTCGNP
jgi:putative ABC transport system ATP-binding protein